MNMEEAFILGDYNRGAYILGLLISGGLISREPYNRVYVFV